MGSILSSLKSMFQNDQTEEEEFKDDFIYFWDDIQVEDYVEIEQKTLSESIQDNLPLFFHILIFISFLPIIILSAMNELLITTILSILSFAIINISYLMIRNKYVTPNQIITENVEMLAENNLTGNEELLYAKEEYEVLNKYDQFRSSIVLMLRSFDENSEKLEKEIAFTRSMNNSIYRAIDQINLTIENRVASVGNYQETKGYVNQISSGLDNFTENFDRTLNSVSEVNNILKSIGKQTTMLALNAGIEAAKAGLRGKGFEVVSSNLRRLAQHAIDSSKRIGSLVDEISEKAKTSIEEITVGMNMLNDLLDNNHTDITSLNDELYTSIRDLDEINKQLSKIEQLAKFEKQELKKMTY